MWLNVKEIAKYMGVSKENVYRMLEKKTIPAHRIGKVWRFKTDEVDKAIIQGKLE